MYKVGKSSIFTGEPEHGTAILLYTFYTTIIADWIVYAVNNNLINYIKGCVNVMQYVALLFYLK